MTFLSPMAGIIAAAVCAPILIALYLLRLRRRPVRVSSVLFWEQAAKDVQANVPLRWLRPSVLLFLQILALASFLIALARPAIDAGSRPVERLVILIDASASMAAPGAPDGDASRTRLDEAKDRALEIVDRALRSGGDAPARVAVVSFGAAPTLETTFVRERARIERAVNAVAQTDQPADLGAALRLVEAQIATPGDDGGAPSAEGGARVVLIGDGAADAPLGATVGGAEFAFIRVGPAPGDDRDNLGIAQISARRDYEDPALVRLFARVVNAGPIGRDAALTLRADGNPVRATTVFVPAASDDGLGETPIALDARLAGAATLTLSLARADDLAADNAAALTIGPASRLRLLLVAPSGDTLGPDPFLLRALEALEPAQFVRVTIDEFERRVLESGWLGQFSLAVFDRVWPSATPRVPSLSFGVGVPGASLIADPDAPGSARIASWERSHPAMRFVSLDTLIMRAPPSIAGTDGAGTRLRTLAQAEGGPVIALVEGAEANRIVVSFELAASNWPVQVGFAVFLANAVAHLAPESSGAPGRAGTTGEPAVVRAAPGATEVVATGPIERRAPVREGQREVSLGFLPLAGVYRITGAAPGDESLAVNLASEVESSIATRNDPPRIGGGQAGVGVGAAAPREIWRWFVLLGFLLATIEWMLQAWRLRR